MNNKSWRFHAGLIRSAGLLAVAPLTLCALGSGCKPDDDASSPRSESSGAWFVDVTEASRIDFEHVAAIVKRYYAPENNSGGVGLLDYDGDGFLDIYFVQGGALVPSTPDRPGNRLYRNLGDGTFEDVTEASGTGDRSYGSGCTCADYDRDGDVDIYIANTGPNVLYRNNGDGTFTDVTEQAGVGGPGYGTSTAFADYDGDGYLDIFVVNYIRWSPSVERKCFSALGQQEYCSPNSYHNPEPDTLYHNTGRGTFEDVSESSGIHEAFGNGLGVAPGDFNGDGLTDFYVANDQMPNQLWLNTGDGRFVEDALMRGCALNHVGAAEAGMGVMGADIDYDGDLDLFMVHLIGETNTLYLNNDGFFDDVTTATGLGAPSFPFTGFGVALADFDHDTDQDLYIANGRIALGVYDTFYRSDNPYAEPNQLFEATGPLQFNEVMPQGGTAKLLVESSRGAAFGDLDNDGRLDIVVGNNGARPHVLHNVAGVRGHWVMFRVLNANGSYALGTSVKIEAGGITQWRQVQRAYSYCASNDPRVHFGLGPAEKVDKVVVRLLNGTSKEFGSFAADRIHELRLQATR